MHAFIIHKTVLHFGKSVPNILRGISHSKVTADKAECPTAVFCFSWDVTDGLKRERKVSPEEGTLHQLCADKNIPGDLEMAGLLQRSHQGLTETHLHRRELDISPFPPLILLNLSLPPPSLLPFCLLGLLFLLEKHTD